MAIERPKRAAVRPIRILHVCVQDRALHYGEAESSSNKTAVDCLQRVQSC